MAPQSQICDKHTPAMRESTKLLGLDHGTIGDLTGRTQAGGRTALAISAGADGPNGVRIFKGDLEVPNEDATGAIDDGDRTLLIIADGHQGHYASHELVKRALERPIPTDPLDLLSAVLALATPPAEHAPGATTLLLAIWDRRSRQGFGVSFGDSSLMVISRTAEPVFTTRKDDNYVAPWNRESLDPRRGHEFEFTVPHDGIALAFTDGIDECCYENPGHSLQAGDLWGLLEETGGEVNVEAYVRELAELALSGVDDHPGGQDNLAIAATR